MKWLLAVAATALLPDGARDLRGLREGVYVTTWPSGTPRTIHRYRHDVFDGVQLAFHKSGALAEVRSYRDGYEEGTQRFFNERGTLVANYTFKNGRRYGIVGRSDCVSMGAR